MNAWKVILATLVIFGAGVVTGGLLVSYAVHANLAGVNTPPKQQVTATIPPWQIRSRELLRRMDRELDLTPEQHKQLEKIIAESQERTKAIWKPIAGPMAKEVQRTMGEIRNVLTPEQRRKFNELVRPGQGQIRRHFPTNAPSSGITNSISTNAVPVNP